MAAEDWQFLLGGGVAGSIIMTIVNKFLNRKQDAIESITRIITLQTENSKRLDDNNRKLEEKVDVLNQRIDKLEQELSKRNKITRAYSECDVPNEKCPVYLSAKKHGLI